MHIVWGHIDIDVTQGTPDATDIEYSVLHALEAEFGGDGWAFEVEEREFRPNHYYFRFESSLDADALDARLDEVGPGGRTDDGEWEGTVVMSVVD